MDHESDGKNQDDLEEASDLEQADLKLGEKLAQHRDHPAVQAAAKAGEIGDQEPLYALSAGLFLFGLWKRDRRLAGSGLAMLTATALADLGKSGLKNLVSRSRPNVLLDEKHYEASAGGSPRKPEQSFPSGHMAGSVAAARALSRNFPRTGAAAGVAACGIGLTRIAQGAHWPLDVAAGAFLGLAAEAASATLLEAGRRIVLRRIPSAHLPVLRTLEPARLRAEGSKHRPSGARACRL